MIQKHSNYRLLTSNILFIGYFIILESPATKIQLKLEEFPVPNHRSCLIRTAPQLPYHIKLEKLVTELAPFI